MNSQIETQNEPYQFGRVHFDKTDVYYSESTFVARRFKPCHSLLVAGSIF